MTRYCYIRDVIVVAYEPFRQFQWLGTLPLENIVNENAIFAQTHQIEITGIPIVEQL